MQQLTTTTTNTLKICNVCRKEIIQVSYKCWQCDCFTLTTREIETLEMVASGVTVYQIACKLGVSVSTVKTFLKHTRIKLNVYNSLSAVIKLLKTGHISLQDIELQQY